MLKLFEFELNMKLSPDEIKLMNQYLLEKSPKTGFLDEFEFKSIWRGEDFKRA